MSYSIDNIPMTDYGLYISTHLGPANLPENKSEFFTVYGNEGFQITKRKANDLELHGFIIANNLTQLKAYLNSIYTVFKSPGIRAVEINGDVINCFAADGYTISNVRIGDMAFCQLKMKLTIV